jgi:hypothetical protein
MSTMSTWRHYWVRLNHLQASHVTSIAEINHPASRCLHFWAVHLVQWVLCHLSVFWFDRTHVTQDLAVFCGFLLKMVWISCLCRDIKGHKI